MEILSLDLDDTTAFTLVQDSDSFDPRKEFDNLGTMVCWHRRYTLGDKHSFESPEDFKEDVTEEDNVILPVYMYDHSGIALSSTPFSCPWDSGLLGFIYVSKDAIKKAWKTDTVTDAVLENVKACLMSELETYSQYLNGEVYGVVLTDRDRNMDDSCYGLYGAEGVLSYVKDNVPQHFDKIAEALRI